MYVHLLAQECNIEEIPDEEEPPAKSSKDKKANGPDSVKAPSLVFKITSKIPYKTVLKGILYFKLWRSCGSEFSSLCIFSNRSAFILQPTMLLF